MSMSLFGGSLMGGMDDDPFFGSAIRQMRSMDNMMNNMFHDSFGMAGMFREFESARTANMHSFMAAPFGMPPLMGGFGRMCHNSTMDALNAPIGGCNYSSSSTVISMTSGPDGRPQVYKATSSTKVAPGGIKETQRTVTDSVSGTKKMAIGHHIGDRAHIIEKEQNYHTGDREEREDFINLDEDDAEDFDKEWQTKTRSSISSDVPRVTSQPRIRHSYGGYPAAITAAPSSQPHRDRTTTPLVSARRSIKTPRTQFCSSSSRSQRAPYNVPGHEKQRKSKNVKTVTGSTNTQDRQV